MAVKGNSSSERTTRWDVLLTNLKPSLPEMPHVADDLKALDALLPQARTLETQQADLRSQASAASIQLKKILRQGDQIRARVGATLKGKFGFSDAALSKYGFKPLPEVRKRKSAALKTPPVTESQQGAGEPGTHSGNPPTGSK